MDKATLIELIENDGGEITHMIDGTYATFRSTGKRDRMFDALVKMGFKLEKSGTIEVKLVS